MSSKKTLLLNSSYESLSFIDERRAIKLLVKDKVEVVSSWEDEIHWTSGKIQLPSILRLKIHVKRNYTNTNFSRKTLVKRDESTCQYCKKLLSGSQLTIDHVYPRSLGGDSSFLNCVVCCKSCNSKKSNKTLEQSGMTLIKKPRNPSFSTNYYIVEPIEFWNDEWNIYLKSIQ